MSKSTLYCLKCRQNKKCENTHLEQMVKSGKKINLFILKGLCPTCGTKCNKFVSGNDVKKTH